MLRDYQLDAVSCVDSVFTSGKQTPLLVLPTGAGKTVIAAEVIRREVAAGGRVLFVAPRRELIFQTSQKLDAIGVAHGVLLAGADERDGLEAAVQVASIDTLASRVLRRGRLMLPSFTLIIVDEAHLSITQVRQRLLELWPDARRIGLTATPTRKDGKALGVLYDTLIEPATTASLTTAGYLSPARYFSWPPPDLRNVRTVAGDFNNQDLNRVMNRPELLGDIVQTWLTHAPDRRTVVFATSIKHAVALAEAFRQVDVTAEHVDAKTPTAARAATMARFASGTTQVLCNCFLAAYGFDLPALSAIVLARPTKSLMLYLQMLGRGLRIADGKSDCLVLDHAGNVHRHGFATDERPWTLDGIYALEPAAVQARPKRQAIECPKCHAVFTGLPSCPECGYVLRQIGRLVSTLDGELVEIGSSEKTSAQDSAKFFAELRGFAEARGYKPGWAAYKFRERFGDFPPRRWNTEPVAVPSLATQRWVKSRTIAWAKAQQRSAS